MNMTINFDMDGTIANFYGVEGWLNYLMDENPLPYEIAKPLLNMNILARQLNRMIKKGWSINIISWLSKNGSDVFDERVTKAKKQWLGKHLASVKFDNITIVKYGTPKHTLGTGYLFDDEIGNREAWGEGAYDVQNIIEILKEIEKRG